MKGGKKRSSKREKQDVKQDLRGRNKQGGTRVCSQAQMRWRVKGREKSKTTPPSVTLD